MHGSSLADLATVLVAPSDHNCFADNQYGTSAPTNIEQVMPCEGASAGDPNDGALPVDQFLDTAKNPSGRNYKDTPVPAKQQNLAKASKAKAQPAGAPPPVDVDAITRPS